MGRTDANGRTTLKNRTSAPFSIKLTPKDKQLLKKLDMEHREKTSSLSNRKQIEELTLNEQKVSFCFSKISNMDDE